ncbi:metallophosphoesterase family protein [Bacillus mesophilum]|uniref:DNA repair exonuclease n=1 Tax=Bacillus mesophilum TaxID=1071718 RepID=A0A7V7UTP4_9BACI|nr:DNA repair exonuclease [Bacillus mesophilum]KAB2330973.1 DNA repair exonuclease [Bacillus mesophilum]
MKKVTFIHAADLHLDSGMAGLRHLPQPIFSKLRESTFESLSSIVDAAIAHSVDFVVLAGDLFDAEDRSIRAQIIFIKEMERLAEKGISVFAVHGNHDHMEGSWVHLPLPKNVHLFSNQVETVEFITESQTSVHLYGFSYHSRHVYERMIQHYKKRDGADFDIGILHGQLEGESEHGAYAPFTISELAVKNFDYWALGHIHKRNVIQNEPPIVYPGNTQGRHVKETGDKGCYLVQLSEKGAEMTFINTAPVVWSERELNCEEADSFQEIYSKCLDLIDEEKMTGQAKILILTLQNTDLPPKDAAAIREGELLDLLKEHEAEGEDGFIWIADLLVNERKKWNKEKLMSESAFFAEMFHAAVDLEGIGGSLELLYKHPEARRFLQKQSEDELDSISKEAENLLMQLLYQS